MASLPSETHMLHISGTKLDGKMLFAEFFQRLISSSKPNILTLDLPRNKCHLPVYTAPRPRNNLKPLHFLLDAWNLGFWPKFGRWKHPAYKFLFQRYCKSVKKVVSGLRTSRMLIDWDYTNEMSIQKTFWGCRVMKITIALVIIFLWIVIIFITGHRAWNIYFRTLIWWRNAHYHYA